MRTTTFHSKLNIAKQNVKISDCVSKAAREDLLTDLRNLLPNEKEIEQNNQFLFFAGNAAAIGLVNANGCGMLPEVAIATKDTYIKKPVNWEHDRGKIIGFISDVAFSSFGDNKLITAEQASNSGLFNIVVSGIIWRIANGGMEAEIAEMCDQPNTPWFHDLSISWEIGFDKYIILKGSKNISKGTLIKNEEDVLKYTRYLNGEISEDGYIGNGFTPEGEEVYMIIDGEPTCLSIGLTINPASQVRGLVTTPNKILPELEEDPEEQDDNEMEDDKEMDGMSSKASILVKKPQKNEEKTKIVEIIAKNISQKENKTVKKIKVMKKFTKMDEIHDYFTEASLDSSAPRAIENFLVDELAKGAAVYEEKITLAATELQATKDEAKAVADKLALAEAELKTLKDQFTIIEAKVEEERKQNVLNSRIETLAETYDISDASVKKTIVKQIRELDDESYASWLKPDEIGGILLASRVKSEKVDPEVAAKGFKEAKASVTIPNTETPQKAADYSELIKNLIIK